MPRLRIVAICVLVMLCQGVSVRGQSKRIVISGTHLTVEPRLDFRIAVGFTGLESIASQASVMVTEIPVPYGRGAVAMLSKSYTKEALRARGFMLESQVPDTQAGLPCLTIKGSLSRGGTQYIQWIHLLESEEPRVAQIQVAAPQAQFKKIADDIGLMLSTFRWVAHEAPYEPFYALDLPEGWGLAKRFGVLDMYTSSGRFPKQPEDSALIVGILNDRPSDFPTYVKGKNLKRNHYAKLTEVESTFLTIDGRKANISHVSGVRAPGGEKVLIQYCYIMMDNAVVLIDAERTKQIDKTAFDSIAKSWHVKEGTR